MNTPIEIHCEIKSSTEKVWSALTNKVEMKKWYFDIQDF